MAKKFLEDKTRVHMAARRTAKAFETDYRSLNKNAPPVPPTGNPKELQQVFLSSSNAIICLFTIPSVSSICGNLT